MLNQHCWSSGWPDCLFSCNDHPPDGDRYLLLLYGFVSDPLIVEQNYSIIFVYSSNNICVEVPLFRYLCQGASVDPDRAARQLPLRLPGGWAGSRCVSVKIFFGKVSKYQTEPQIWRLSIKLSPGCFGSHQMSWLKNTLIAIVKTVDYQNNPG